MSEEAIERHHPDKKNKPEVILKIPRRAHQVIHGTVPIDTPLSRLMRRYDAVTKLVASMKNWTKAHEKDFGERPDIGLDHAKELKKQLRKKLKTMVKEDVKKVVHIRGLGPRYLAGILAYAHPNRFPSLRKFLFYCGYTEASGKLKHYNRRIKPLVYETVKNLIMHKDRKYYFLYLKIKKDLGNHYRAMSRVGTFLLKEIYQIFHEQRVGGLMSESTRQSEFCVPLPRLSAIYGDKY